MYGGIARARPFSTILGQTEIYDIYFNILYARA